MQGGNICGTSEVPTLGTLRAQSKGRLVPSVQEDLTCLPQAAKRKYVRQIYLSYVCTKHFRPGNTVLLGLPTSAYGTGSRRGVAPLLLPALTARCKWRPKRHIISLPVCPVGIDRRSLWTCRGLQQNHSSSSLPWSLVSTLWYACFLNMSMTCIISIVVCSVYDSVSRCSGIEQAADCSTGKSHTYSSTEGSQACPASLRLCATSAGYLEGWPFPSRLRRSF